MGRSDIQSACSCVTAAEAVRAGIRSGDNVVFGHAAAVPVAVPEAMIEQADRLRGVRIFHMFTLGEGRYMGREYKDSFRHFTNFAAANSRIAVAEDRADFLPCHFSRTPGLFDDVFPPDVAVIQVSEPDSGGFCSFGLSCDYTKPAAEKAKTVIAEINPKMPYVGGDNLIHVSKIDYMVPVQGFLPELPASGVTEAEENIGKHCASLINDGDTLQLGIGAIPDAVLLFLGSKRDLGIHSEMFSDGIVDLVGKGVITGMRKSLHPGKIVATFIMGSRRLYDFVNGNPDVELYPVDYVNDPRVISMNDNMVSVNSCIEVDLQGQISSESMGLKQFSGTGGQVDYIRGSAWSSGGRSIIAIPSTASGGKVSRIVPFLSAGAAVTTTRQDADFIVTEYGIARMRGRTLKERARDLISIAHPDFREGLEQEYCRRFRK